MIFLSLLLLLCASAFFSAAEVSLFSMSHMKISIFENDSNFFKRSVALLLKNPRDLLVTILISNVAVNIVIQNVIANSFYWGEFASVMVSFLLVLILGEILPKSVALSLNDHIVLFVAIPIQICRMILTPLRYLIDIASRIFFKFNIFYSQNPSREELFNNIDTSRDMGILSEDEASLIKGSMKIEDMHAREIMKGRNDILFYDVGNSIIDLHHLFSKSETLPVVDGNIDNVIGTISSKEYFSYDGNNIRKILKKALFVPESAKIDKVLSYFQIHMEDLAIVVNEYGELSGLLEYDDIFRSVIGSALDKDKYEEMTMEIDGSIITSGRCMVSKISEIFHISIDDKAVTLNGLILNMLGRMPKCGDECRGWGLIFKILSVKPTYVERIEISNVADISSM